MSTRENIRLIARSSYTTVDLLWFCVCSLFSAAVLDALSTVLTAKSDNDVMCCLQSYQGLRIDRSLVY